MNIIIFKKLRAKKIAIINLNSNLDRDSLSIFIESYHLITCLKRKIMSNLNLHQSNNVSNQDRFSRYP